MAAAGAVQTINRIGHRLEAQLPVISATLLHTTKESQKSIPKISFQASASAGASVEPHSTPPPPPLSSTYPGRVAELPATARLFSSVPLKRDDDDDDARAIATKQRKPDPA